jgi:hypothetical protein
MIANQAAMGKCACLSWRSKQSGLYAAENQAANQPGKSRKPRFGTCDDPENRCVWSKCCCTYRLSYALGFPPAPSPCFSRDPRQEGSLLSGSITVTAVLVSDAHIVNQRTNPNQYVFIDAISIQTILTTQKMTLRWDSDLCIYLRI